MTLSTLKWIYEFLKQQKESYVALGIKDIEFEDKLNKALIETEELIKKHAKK